jgi:transcriptional regulator with XRE-family HTH domain
MKRTTKNLADVIREKLAANPDLAARVAEERLNADLASELYALRTAAGLTQRQLAERVGTHQSVIARLEDADYDGHSLKMLDRLAEALGKRLEIRFVARPAVAPTAASTKRRVAPKRRQRKAS